MLECFLAGFVVGVILVTVVAHCIINATDRFWKGRLDYWSGRVTELQEQVNDLEARQDSGDEWKKMD